MTFLFLKRNQLLLVLMLAGLCGCVSTPRSTAPVHVLVTASGIVCYQGEQFGGDQLAARLQKANVDKSQEVRVHMEDTRNTRLLKQLHDGLMRKGYKHILFLAEPRATAEVVGEPETRTEAPVRSSPAP
jgi:hypothetical protein